MYIIEKINLAGESELVIVANNVELKKEVLASGGVLSDEGEQRLFSLPPSRPFKIIIGQSSLVLVITKMDDANMRAARRAILNPDNLDDTVVQLINLVHYVNQNEAVHFMEQPSADHVLMSALIAEIGISGHVAICEQLAHSLMSLALELGGEEMLPFQIMCQGYDSINSAEDACFTSLTLDDVMGGDSIVFAERWHSFQLWR